MSNIIMMHSKDHVFFLLKDYPVNYKFAVYFYVDSKKVKSEWYSSSNILKFECSDKNTIFKFFVRDEKDQLVSQFYVNDKVLIEDELLIKDILKSEINKIDEIKYIYTDEDKNNFKRYVNLLWMLSLSESSSTTYLLKICSVVKSWNKVFNEETLLASKILLERSERTDAVIYYCFSILSVFSWDDAELRINKLFNDLNDVNNLNICRVFKSIFAYESENFDEYCEYIKNVLHFKNPDFDHYIFTPLNTVYTKNSVNSVVKSAVKNKLFGCKIDLNSFSIENKFDYIISLSCDKNYFDMYSEFILNTIQSKCKNQAVFIFLTNGDYKYYAEKTAKYDNVYCFVNNNISDVNRGPVSSVLRYYYSYDLLRKFKKPVLVLDFDSVIFNDFSSILNDLKGYDIGSRVLRKGVLPWEKYTGGFTIFNPTNLSIQLCLELKYLTEKTLKNDKVQWWVDQNLLEASIRQMKYRKTNIRILNTIALRDKYVKMPVGSSDTKKILMKKLYDESYSII